MQSLKNFHETLEKKYISFSRLKDKDILSHVATKSVYFLFDSVEKNYVDANAFFLDVFSVFDKEQYDVFLKIWQIEAYEKEEIIVKSLYKEACIFSVTLTIKNKELYFEIEDISHSEFYFEINYIEQYNDTIYGKLNFIHNSENKVYRFTLDYQIKHNKDTAYIKIHPEYKVYISEGDLRNFLGINALDLRVDNNLLNLRLSLHSMFRKSIDKNKFCIPLDYLEFVTTDSLLEIYKKFNIESEITLLSFYKNNIAFKEILKFSLFSPIYY